MYVSRRSIIATFAVALIMAVFLAWPSTNIPDWESYRKIYDNNGSWLKGRSESIIFLFIMDGFKTISPFSSYEAFRMTLFVIFSATMWLVIDGRVIAYPKERVWMVLIALLVLGSLRFTSQIREGIVVVFFLLALGFLQHSAGLYRRETLVTYGPARRFLFASWGLVALGAGVHMSGAILFVTTMFAALMRRYSRASKSLILGLVWLVIAAVILTYAFGNSLATEITQLALSRSGTRDLAAGFFTGATLLYWTVNAGLWRGVYVLCKKTAMIGRTDAKEIGEIMILISGPLAALCLITIFGLKFVGTTPVVTVLFVRAFDLMTTLSLVYVAMFSKSKIGCGVALAVVGLKSVLQITGFF